MHGPTGNRTAHVKIWQKREDRRVFDTGFPSNALALHLHGCYEVSLVVALTSVLTLWIGGPVEGTRHQPHQVMEQVYTCW